MTVSTRLAKELCPDGRRSSPTKDHKGRAVVDPGSYIPYFFAAINNALSRGASRLYLQAFDIGIAEWRVISMLAIEPRIPAQRICEVISLDKAATSRSLSRLRELGYLEFKASDRDNRRKIWWLNARGYGLHDKILAVALERERNLIQGVEPDDLEVFLKVMRMMRQNVDRLGGEDV
ncbi:MAG: winged helix-turn-helix transcriptional regulator [Alphaproteobacteria bacterium]|jgi:DNA-binding MarR family transcriptional regulator|nr:winged helix-turn-helix transcriptional regulator [Alphaproteobacteria bacterium]MBT4019950.1 winged helix-turn-helix transcriptional regulator [Alphaproteobacteria bacterium]MBT4966749.1 winged helix-turn-helix transcriptional regulator [Alphaproteobacteria bacterium]MBT5158446.1 winged helix-turn-helix transcriptional regulator [Alphaproteobacteria bacterium]